MSENSENDEIMNDHEKTPSFEGQIIFKGNYGSERFFFARTSVFFIVAVLGSLLFGIIAPHPAGIWASGFAGGIAIVGLYLAVYSTGSDQ